MGRGAVNEARGLSSRALVLGNEENTFYDKKTVCCKRTHSVIKKNGRALRPLPSVSSSTSSPSAGLARLLGSASLSLSLSLSLALRLSLSLSVSLCLSQALSHPLRLSLSPPSRSRPLAKANSPSLPHSLIRHILSQNRKRSLTTERVLL